MQDRSWTVAHRTTSPVPTARAVKADGEEPRDPMDGIMQCAMSTARDTVLMNYLYILV